MKILSIQHNNLTVIYNSLTVDCGIPLPPGNGSIVSYSGTKVGDRVIYKCHDGFRPSHEMSGICMMDVMWQPVPEQQTCTLIKGKIVLEPLASYVVVS